MIKKIPFTASARTALLIGAENFSNPEGAIIELVKNAYDADSPCCYVFFYRETNNTKNKEGNDNKDLVTNKIIILDYGSGMDLNTIEECWMRIGTDDKLQNVKTNKGRIKSGAKGIGRFALNRLGKRTSMLTIKDDENGFIWKVNWDEFLDTHKNVSDVKADIQSVYIDSADVSIYSLEKDFNVKLPKFNHGTILSISDINDEWTEDRLSHLYSSLEDLIPSFNEPSFKIFLYAQCDKINYGEIKKATFDDYDYRVVSQYDKDDGILEVEIWRNELDEKRLETSYNQLFELEAMKKHPYTLDDFKAGHYNIKIKLSDLKFTNRAQLLKYQKNLGSFFFEFMFLKTSKSDIKDESSSEKYPYRPFSSSTRREWLKRNQGIKIYRDKFRVRPYGENGDDWLHLSERYALSPGGAGQRLGGYHVRQTQIAGAVEISRTDNMYLQDKSGREGIQENAVFDLFKEVLIGIIGIMEVDRNVVMYNLSKLYDLRNPKGKAKKEADAAQKEYTEANYNALVKGYNILKDELEHNQEEIRILRNLASTGLLVTSFAHELRNIATRSSSRSKDLKAALDLVTSEEEVKKLGIIKYENPYYILNILAEEDQRVRSWVEFSINSVNKDKRIKSTFNLKDYFKKFKENWQSVMDEMNIKLSCDGFTEYMIINGYLIDFDTIFNNLLSNSIYAIKAKKSTVNRYIKITGRTIGDFVSIDFVDSGKGLDKQYKKNPDEIFNAFESSKTDTAGNIVGSGLGLYIVNSIISEYKGSSISYMTNVTDGFGINISLKIKK